ncbi:MAG: 3'-5' exonuclease [Ktedonobacterales bacterium]|nr:3'-5' exonuclease [Ktedonobacterales bacterium]
MAKDEGRARQVDIAAPPRRRNRFKGMTPAEVAAWARMTLALPNLLVLDTETTGQRETEITEIGVLDGQGAPVLHTLVRARGHIHPTVAALTGITDAMLIGAPRFADLAPAVARLLRESVVLIYNASYDCGVLAAEFARIPAPLPSYEPHCAMLAYAAYRNVPNRLGYGQRWHSLGNACAYEGITHQEAHRVLGDCQATLALLRRMAGASRP